MHCNGIHLCGDRGYVSRWHLRKANNRCDHGTEQIRVSHWVCNNKVKNNGKETYKLFI